MYSSVRSSRWLLVCLTGVTVMFVMIYWIVSSQHTENIAAQNIKDIDFLQGNQVGIVLNDNIISMDLGSVKLPVLATLPELKQNFHNNLNIFNATKESKKEQESIDSNKCVPMKTTKGQTPICVYDPKIDIWISRYLVEYGIWENTGVNVMTSILIDNPGMQVLDVGCNMGVFTIQAAKMGREVIAIDANKFNLRLLSKSLKLGGLQNNAMLIWNAISDVHETIELTITYGNIGASFVKDSDGDKFKVDKHTNITKQNALTITLDDLIGLVKGTPLFMKIDIEGSEWKAFNGGQRFFREANVRYILMEWTFVKLAKKCDTFARFISNFGYTPFYYSKPHSSELLRIESANSWPNDILWVKN